MKLFSVLPLFGFLVFNAFAANVEFTAKVDQNEISADESLSLKFTVYIKDGNPRIEEPEFQAPQFDTINQFQNTQIQSVYENGKFQMQHTRQFTYLLRPKATGMFPITNLSIKIDGKKVLAPNINIRVDAGSQGTTYAQNPTGVGVGSLRGIPKPSAATREPFFVRAEISKSSVYKGEQVIVSYYLYRKTKVFNIQVAQYPVLTGFLREDLDIPVMGTQLQSEETVVNGTPYQRSLLARYAAYPLKEGELKIDPMAIKANYYPVRPGMGHFNNDDDSMDPFQNFFGAFNASQLTQRSPLVSVNVLALPIAGKPANFSGGVGNFEVTASVDKAAVKVNDALNLSVRVEGRGNVSGVELPAVTWPKGVEMYESKGNTKTGRAGIGEKVFEVLLIPRSGGRLSLPPFEFSFFDVEKKQYVTKKTNPIEINVDGPVQPDQPKGDVQATVPTTSTQAENQPKTPVQIKFSFSWADLLERLKALKYLVIGLLALGLGWLGFDFAKRIRTYLAKKRTAINASFRVRTARLRQRSAQMHTMSEQERRAFLDECEAVFLDELERKSGLAVRGLTRVNLKSILIERGIIREENWTEIQKILDSLDQIRFSGMSTRTNGSEVLEQITKLAEKF